MQLFARICRFSSRRLGSSLLFANYHLRPALGMDSSPRIALERDKLSEQKTITALVVPKKQCACTMKLFKGRTFKMPKVKCLVDNPGDEESKLLLLDESLLPTSIPAELNAPLSAHLTENSIEVTTHTFNLTYENLSAEAALKKVLPADVDVPSSFEAVGHIAHFNLREPHIPYRHVIGQICIDKNPSIKTVVTKVKEIENEFRVFDMEVIAGENNFVTEVSQHGLRFKLDFSKVFWNSRLEHEHKRLVDKYFKRGQVILDVMAGIGPFAVPAAKSGCVVVANDLNPDSAHWLQVNIGINHVTKNVHPLCMDGRECIRWVSSGKRERVASTADGGDGCARKTGTDEAEWAPPEGGLLWHHAVMNLPRTAVEFCDAFRGTFPQSVWQGQLPLVHCYTFQKSETEADVLRRLEDALGGPLDEPAVVHQVRHVAPEKYHVCITFRVPKAVAFADQIDERENKRQKLDA